ncbi:MAG: prolipoprotein diacylglyceryl transferase [Chloroflexi bacterium]|nr:MAG: prolipoprotein diacylglyceryl transferase [Chloroflexota bacterium]
MEFHAEFIQIGQVQIRYYGIIIVTAMLVAAWAAARLAKRRGLDPDHIWGALTWAIIPGIIFARLWFVLFPPISAVAEGRDTAWYFQNFFDVNNGAIAIWSGGLSIFGAVIGGFLGAYIYMRRNKLEIPVWLDIAAVAMPLGQAIGRWANYVNQELYGLPTNLPWGISIDAAHRVGEYKSLVDYPVLETRFHPLFLYESLWSLLAFIVLYNIYTRYRNRLRNGDIVLLYIMQYSFIRFLLEFLRIEVAYLPGTEINSSQAITALAFIGALVVFLYRRSRPVSAQEEKPAKARKADVAKPAEEAAE